VTLNGHWPNLANVPRINKDQLVTVGAGAKAFQMVERTESKGGLWRSAAVHLGSLA